MAMHSNIFAWKIPWIEELGRIQFMGLQKNVTRDKEGHCNDKGIIQEEEKTIIDIYAPNPGAPEYIRQEYWSGLPFPSPKNE